MVNPELRSEFKDEARRIAQTSSEFPCNIAHFGKMLREVGYTEETDDEKILAEFGPELIGGGTLDDLVAYRNAKIEELVEAPCHPLAKALIERGAVTYWSNAFNASPKGVFWYANNDRSEKFFTSILNGRTYIDRGKYYPNPDFTAEVKGHDFSDVMPEGWDPHYKFDELGY